MYGKGKRNREPVYTEGIHGDHSKRLERARERAKGVLKTWYYLQVDGRVSTGDVAAAAGATRGGTRHSLQWLIDNGYLELVTPGCGKRLAVMKLTRRGRNLIRSRARK